MSDFSFLFGRVLHREFFVVIGFLVAENTIHTTLRNIEPSVAHAYTHIIMHLFGTCNMVLDFLHPAIVIP